MKLHPFMPRFAIPTAPLWALLLRDILIFLVGVGLFFLGLWTDRKIAAQQIENCRLKADYYQAMSDGLVSKRTSEQLKTKHFQK